MQCEGKPVCGTPFNRVAFFVYLRDNNGKKTKKYIQKKITKNNQPKTIKEKMLPAKKDETTELRITHSRSSTILCYFAPTCTGRPAPGIFCPDLFRSLETPPAPNPSHNACFSRLPRLLSASSSFSAQSLCQQRVLSVLRRTAVVGRGTPSVTAKKSKQKKQDGRGAATTKK